MMLSPMFVFSSLLFAHVFNTTWWRFCYMMMALQPPKILAPPADSACEVQHSTASSQIIDL
jgi:hypothetical protein